MKCVFCGEPQTYRRGGFTTLAPIGQAAGTARACRACTADLVCAWAKEERRLERGGRGPVPSTFPKGPAE
jgi:hypothetical protein